MTSCPDHNSARSRKDDTLTNFVFFCSGAAHACSLELQWALAVGAGSFEAADSSVLRSPAGLARGAGSCNSATSVVVDSTSTRRFCCLRSGV